MTDAIWDRLERAVIWPDRIAVAPSRIRVRLVDGASVCVTDSQGDRDVPVVTWPGEVISGPAIMAADEGQYKFVVVTDGVIKDIATTTVRPDESLFERNSGVTDSDLLAGKRVAILGLGSGGSAILRELVRAGVERFVLVDHDRMEPGNISRHELDLDDVGRFKVLALRDYVHRRNPNAVVTALPCELAGETLDDIRAELTREPTHVIVCGADNREARLLANRLSITLDIYSLFGSVRRRAFAGDVLQVLPGVTPCYQCFVSSLPLVIPDDAGPAALLGPAPAYSDRPVIVEPGLSLDIAPVALLMAKLTLIRLLRGSGSERFAGLAEDLAAPLFFWLSRREPGTIYGEWPPLEDSTGDSGPRIMQWLGRWMDRREDCQVCAAPSVELTEEERLMFGAAAE